MAQIRKYVVPNMREKFKVINKDVLHWFPGHMGKGLKQMQQKLKLVDCIIEVHDARIPISGRNADFKHTVSLIKPHMLVLNKKDLIEKKDISKIESKLTEENTKHVIFTNCKDQRCSGVRNIFPLMERLIKDSSRFNRVENKEHCVMIIGVPNVGKSSLINTLRNRYLLKSNATQVGAKAGITRSVLTKIKISEEPLVYLLDTPGILTPKVPDIDSGMKLALSACLQDHLVGEDIIADYLLFWLNKHEKFKYVDYFNLKEPTDNIGEVLTTIAVNSNKMARLRHYDGSLVKRPNFDFAANHMLKAFRTGALGKMCLDSDVL